MEELKVFTLHAGNIKVDITNIGACIMRLYVDGIDVVQGFDTPEEYLPSKHLSDFGAVIGRYANRLAKARIAIDWDVIQLPRNNGPNCLHGGPLGWQYTIYDVLSANDTRLELAMVSPDGDNGFPGTVQVRVTYSLSADGSLRIDYHAETDKLTVINMTNHSYFNLNGNLSSSVLNHALHIDADCYTPVNKDLIPLGKHATVDGTPFDFRKAKTIGQDIETENEQLTIGNGYDHNFVLNRPCLDVLSAELSSPVTCIAMQVYTTAPGMQVYTGNFLNGTLGKDGVRYPVRSAVCLETQQYPDSPNHSWPESTGYLYPEHPFDSTTILKFCRK